MKRLFTFLMALLLTWIGANAQITSGTDYMIVNTETEQFLYGSYNWGCRASLGTKPVFWTVTSSSSGTYTLSSKQWTDTKYLYLSGDFYCDGSSTNITLTETDSGIYTISYNGSYMLQQGKNAGTTVTSNAADASHFKFVSLEDVIDDMAGASSANPVDVTALINDANFKPGGNNLTASNNWISTGVTIGSYDTNNHATVACCAESWNQTSFSASQVITLPLKGYYTLGAKGFHRNGGDGSGTNEVSAVLYAGSAEQDLNDLGSSSGISTMAEAYTAFINGSYSVAPITITATNDSETVEIGFKGKVPNSSWAIFGELELLYYGTEEPVLPSHECTADLSHWTTTGNNGTHEVNTWSEETDNSGMVTPFCQNWIASGSTLTAATISHETLTNLEPGHYTVSMDIRIFSEAGNTIGSGTTFNANGVSEDLDSLTTAGGEGHEGSYTPSGGSTETEVYGTYTLDCIVYDDGTLDISIVIPDGVTYNWIAWKNLKVTYTGPIEEPAIGYATADKTVVQPGEEVTITFKKVAPSTGSYTLAGTGFTDSDNGTGSGITVSYSSTADGVFTFTVPEDVDLNSTFTITIPAGQLYYSDAVKSEAQTLTFTVPYMLSDDLMSGMFLKNLYNNDLLSRGKDYGTRADVDFIGIPIELVMNNDGKYIIRYADADLDLASSNYLYGPNWAWADGSATTATTFTIEEVLDEDTQELLGYHFISDLGYLYRYDAAKANNATDTEDNYALAVNGAKNENYSDDNQVIWTFVGIEERDSIKAAWVESQKLALAAEAGITVTSGDDFDKYVASLTETAIVENEISTTDAGSWTSNNEANFTTNGVESYQTATRLTRSFTGLDKGIYKITLNGLDRNSDNAYSWSMYEDGYTDLSESYIYANGYEINLQAWGSEATYASSAYTPNSMTEASNMFGEGKYLNTLYTYVGETGKLDIQIALLVTEYFGWAIVKNFSLYKLDQTETTITWNMTDAGWGTLILPFDAEIPKTDDTTNSIEWTAYTIASVTEDDTDDDIVATLSLTASEAIAANTPYIMGGDAGTYTFKGTPENTANSYTTTGSGVSLTGTLVDMTYDDFTADGTEYVLQVHDDLAFYPIVEGSSSGVTLDAYHCYLTYNATQVDKLNIAFAGTDGETTAIEAVESEEVEGNGAIYDLSGRKVSKAVKGVYIQNGKKVLVK